MNSYSEEDLLKGARDFNQESLAALFDLYVAGLFRYALRLLGDEPMARDCVSETYSRLLKNLSAGMGPEKFLKAYLYRIAHNWINDVYRKSSRLPLNLGDRDYADKKESPEKIAEKSMEKQKMLQALRRLPPDQRQVIVLHFFEEWDYQQIAESMQKQPGNIRVLQHRGLETLHKILGSDGEEGNYE